MGEEEEDTVSELGQASRDGTFVGLLVRRFLRCFWFLVSTWALVVA